MDQFSKDFGGLHSPDDFDLLSLGLVPGQEEQAETADQDEPRINPLHDMDSLEFLLWVEQEALSASAAYSKSLRSSMAAW